MAEIHPGINIFSGADTELGAALTNPTVLARNKGALKRSYPVTFNGNRFPDAEAAYQISKQYAHDNESLMVEILVAKFRQHPELTAEVSANGGAEWLMTCDHLTNARSDSAQRWEGRGVESRYIRTLVKAFLLLDNSVDTQLGQTSLF